MSTVCAEFTELYSTGIERSNCSMEMFFVALLINGKLQGLVCLLAKLTPRKNILTICFNTYGFPGGKRNKDHVFMMGTASPGFWWGTIRPGFLRLLRNDGLPARQQQRNNKIIKHKDIIKARCAMRKDCVTSQKVSVSCNGKDCVTSPKSVCITQRRIAWRAYRACIAGYAISIYSQVFIRSITEFRTI